MRPWRIDNPLSIQFAFWLSIEPVKKKNKTNKTNTPRGDAKAAVVRKEEKEEEDDDDEEEEEEEEDEKVQKEGKKTMAVTR